MSANRRTGAGSFSTIAAFLFGIPLGIAVLWALTVGPLANPTTERYLHHPVEQVEVGMFCCALGTLIVKLLASIRERAAFSANMLPAWDGVAAPPSAAGEMLDANRQTIEGWAGTYLGRRLHAILDFVKSRGAANELDDHLRTLADGDIMSQESSYSLVRFITWAIPILGFLGTVLGITAAISSVTPEALEKEMHKVTGGLSLSFDATALGLGLTMLLMFLTFLVERIDQGVLERVDAYVEAELGHRFQRAVGEHGPVLLAVEASAKQMLQSTDQLVRQQADVWSRSLEHVTKVGRESADEQHQTLISALDESLDSVLTRHARRMVEAETKLLDRQQQMLNTIAQVSEALKATQQQHQQSLVDVSRRLAEQTQALISLQESGGELSRLQETLAVNLSRLAGSGAFEEAVQSLTAAIHLLTTRVIPKKVA